MIRVLYRKPALISENMEAALKEALKSLGLNDATDHPPKMKVVTRRFYELSLLHHPDQPGGDNSQLCLPSHLSSLQVYWRLY